MGGAAFRIRVRFREWDSCHFYIVTTLLATRVSSSSRNSLIKIIPISIALRAIFISLEESTFTFPVTSFFHLTGRSIKGEIDSRRFVR